MKRRIGGIALILVVFLWSMSLAQEQLTITTYYPSPSGSYNLLSSAGNTYLATDSVGVLGVGTNAGLGKFTVRANNGGGADRANQMVVQGLTNGNLKLNLGIHTEASPAYADIGFVEESTAWRNLVLAKNGGNVGIGSNTTPAYRLDVTGGMRVTGADVYMPGLGVFADIQLCIDATTNRVTKMASSRRYKHDIRNYDFDLEKINRLRPVRFKWNADTAHPNAEDVGLIAEEVYEIFPEAVALDKEGRPEAVAYYKMDVILLKNIQELNKKIKNQEAELAAIRKQLDQLSKKGK